MGHLSGSRLPRRLISPSGIRSESALLYFPRTARVTGGLLALTRARENLKACRRGSGSRRSTRFQRLRSPLPLPSSPTSRERFVICWWSRFTLRSPAMRDITSNKINAKFFRKRISRENLYRTPPIEAICWDERVAQFGFRRLIFRRTRGWSYKWIEI